MTATIIAGRFEGKVAVVTGSSQRGIGRASALRLAQEGASVILNARNSARLDNTVSEFVDLGLRAHGVSGDVTVEGTARRLAAAAVDVFGRIDLIINNVGLNAPPARAHLTARAGFAAAVVGSAWSAVDLVAEAMKVGLADGGGSVVNISSTVVRKLLAPTMAYGASKIALESVTRSLAIDLGPEGVRVNAVAPGVTKSEAARPMWEPSEAVFASGLPLRRLGEPDDLAGAITFLLSDDAAYITGQVIDVDGGFVIAGSLPDLMAKAQ